MPPPQRSTRSAPNVLLQSLPKKSRKPRLRSAVHPPGSTRARLEPSGDGNGGEFEDELPTPTRHVTVAVAGSDSEVEAQVPRRRKHAPLPAKRNVVVSPSTQDKLRRLSVGGSVLGASMGETTPRGSPIKKAASVTGKKPSKKPETQDVIVVAPRVGRKRAIADSMDGSNSEEENMRPPSSSGSLDFADLSDSNSGFGPINRPKPKTPGSKVAKAKKSLKKNTNARNATGPISALEDSAPRRKRARMKSGGEDLADQGAQMDRLMLAAIKNPSTPREGVISRRSTLESAEDRLHQEEVSQKVADARDVGTHANRAAHMKKKKRKEKKQPDEQNKREMVEKEKAAKPYSVAQDEDWEDSDREGNQTWHAEGSESAKPMKSNHKNRSTASVPRGASKGFAFVPDDYHHDDGDDEDEEKYDLAHCLDLVQRMADRYNSTTITFDALREDFCALKVLQTPPHGELGYYKLIDTLATPLLANKGARISTHEHATLMELMHIMRSLADFHGTAKTFEANLRRLVRMNLTQLRNIEKAQRAIKHVFDARRYVGDGTKWRVGEMWVGEGLGEEVAREANREAVRKRNEEIEKVLRQRERAVYGYRTPDSVEGKERRRVRSAGEEADERRGQGSIGAGEEHKQDTRADEELDGDEGIRLQSEEIDEESRSSHRAPEGAEEEEEEEQDQGMRVDSGGGSDSDLTENEYSRSDHADDESEHSQGTHTNEKPGYREEYYGYRPFEQQGSSEGRGGTPIVIEDDEVEVVHVEGFGERAVKERARVEREARRGNGGSDGDVSVLEDSEWNEDEVDALFFGIQDYQGRREFDIGGDSTLYWWAKTNAVSREILPD